MNDGVHYPTEVEMVSPAVRCEVIWTQDSAFWAMNVWHLQPSVSQVSQASADDVAGVVGTQWTASGMRPFIHSSVSLHSVRLKDLRQVGTDFFSSDILLPGTVGGDQIPDNVSLVVQLQTAPGSHSGRHYQWGWAELANGATGRPTITPIGSTVLFLGGMSAALALNTQFPGLGVLSRINNTLAAVIDARRTPFAVAQGWQTQRRRTDGLVLL